MRGTLGVRGCRGILLGPVYWHVIRCGACCGWGAGKWPLTAICGHSAAAGLGRPDPVFCGGSMKCAPDGALPALRRAAQENRSSPASADDREESSRTWDCRRVHSLRRLPVARPGRRPAAVQPGPFRRPSTPDWLSRMRPWVCGISGSAPEIRYNPQTAAVKTFFGGGVKVVVQRVA